MKEILSTRIIFQNHYCTKKILDIFNAAKQFDGKTFLYSNHKTIDATNLSKLLSFLLTLGPRSSVNIIAEGANVKNHLKIIRDVMLVPTDHMSQRPNNVLLSSKKYHL